MKNNYATTQLTLLILITTVVLLLLKTMESKQMTSKHDFIGNHHLISWVQA